MTNIDHYDYQLAPYHISIRTSGAIQNGVPTEVFLRDVGSFKCPETPVEGNSYLTMGNYIVKMKYIIMRNVIARL